MRAKEFILEDYNDDGEGARFWGHPEKGIDVFAGMSHQGTDHSEWLMEHTDLYPEELSENIDDWANPEQYDKIFELQQDALYDYVYSNGWCQGYFNPSSESYLTSEANEMGVNGLDNKSVRAVTRLMLDWDGFSTIERFFVNDSIIEGNENIINFIQTGSLKGATKKGAPENKIKFQDYNKFMEIYHQNNK